MGRAFYAGSSATLAVKPRLFPLVVGPTGAGKSHLVKLTAETLRANHLRVTYGDWVPRGAREGAGEATTQRIIEAVLSHDRVLLHIDELDKCQLSYEHSWTRSIANDIWNVLDGELRHHQAADDATAARLRKRVASGLWIVGSGTWQQVFEEASRAGLGFNAQPPPPVAADPVALREKIVQARMIPTELLSRFAGELQFIFYPETVEEKQRLLDESGILELARSIGFPVSVNDLNFAAAGMRCLESLLTRVVIAAQEQREAAGQPEAVPAEPAVTPPATVVAKEPVLPPAAESGEDDGLPLVRIARDPFAGAYAVWFDNSYGDRPNMDFRFRRIQGRCRRGWGEVCEPDPALLGFKTWCCQQGLPMPENPELAFGPGAALPKDATQIRLVADARALHELWRATSRATVERASRKKRYDAIVRSSLPGEVIAEFEQYARHIMTRGLTHGAEAKLPPDFCIVEVHRRFVADVHRGTLLANDWWHQEALDDASYGVSVVPHLRKLWQAAVDAIDHVDRWDSVTDCYFVPEVLHQDGEAMLATDWEQLTAGQRERIERFFEAQQRT